ncbi:MAG: FAD-binding oxidoreductase [Candidatus Melainabacteria bacterium]|nr:MAG: FAD-binding oxidoreductase [Candidatus Melainabacteria bacterium]
MTNSIWFDSKGREARTEDSPVKEFDVAIIGGGILGVSCAYFLSKRKNLKVALIEQKCLAYGSSGRNAGFVLRGIETYYNQCIDKYGREKAKYVYAFAEESQAVLRRFVDECKIDFEYDPCGSYVLADSIEELEDLEKSYELLRQDGFGVELIKADPTDRGFYGALLNGGDFGIHPVKLVRALAQFSKVELLENEPVQRIETQRSSQKTLIHTNNEKILAGKTLIATNAYTPYLEPWFGPKLQVARAQMLSTYPLKNEILDRVCYANYGWIYFRQLKDKRLLLGGKRNTQLQEEVGLADIVTAPIQIALEEYLTDRFPEAAGVGIQYRWSGSMAFTSDGLPLLGKLPQHPEVYFAVGCNGHGMGYSTNMAQQLVALALDGKEPSVFCANRSSLKNSNSTLCDDVDGP